jgi:hypothetical protein
MDERAYAVAARHTGVFNHCADGAAADDVASFAFAPYPQQGAVFDESYLHHEWSAWGPWDAEGYSGPEHEEETPITAAPSTSRARLTFHKFRRAPRSQTERASAVEGRAAEPAAEELPVPELVRLVTQDQVELGVPTTWFYKFDYEEHLDYAARLAEGLRRP